MHMDVHVHTGKRAFRTYVYMHADMDAALEAGFQHLSLASDAILLRFAKLPTALGVEWPLAKRCVRAVKSFQALFGILHGRLVDS